MTAHYYVQPAISGAPAQLRYREWEICGRCCEPYGAHGMANGMDFRMPVCLDLSTDVLDAPESCRFVPRGGHPVPLTR